MSHLTWSIVYTKWINLIGSYAKQKRVIGPEKVTPLLKFTRRNTSVASRGMRREQNRTAKVTDLENPMMLETSSSFRHRSSPVSRKAWKLYNCSKYRRSWKNTLGKLAVAVNQEAIGFEFWMKGALVTEICVLMFHSWQQFVSTTILRLRIFKINLCHKHFVYRDCYIREKEMVSNHKINLKTNFLLSLVSLNCRLRLLE